MLKPAQLDEFAERAPPDPGVRGPHSYVADTIKNPATALLADSPAFGLAEVLTGRRWNRPGSCR